MRWDPTGERLVVSFQANTVADNCEEKEAEDSGLLCVFSTKISPSNVVILPLGFIRGDADETPNAFEFAQHFKDGSLLTIVSYSMLIKLYTYGNETQLVVSKKLTSNKYS